MENRNVQVGDVQSPVAANVSIKAVKDLEDEDYGNNDKSGEASERVIERANAQHGEGVMSFGAKADRRSGRSVGFRVYWSSAFSATMRWFSRDGHRCCGWKVLLVMYLGES